MPVILFSSKVSASANIASHLFPLGFEQAGEKEWKWERTRAVDTGVERILEVPTDFDADYFLVLSTHRSAANTQSLTVHIPGNWSSADMGGSPRTLNISFPAMQKSILLNLARKNKQHGLGFSVNYEVDHHGPTISKSILFVEIGSSEKEWSNPLAGKVVAEALFQSISEPLPDGEPVFGVGGGHYAPKFTSLAQETELQFGHMLPKYKADEIAEDTFAQALEKNTAKVECLILDKKGLNGPQREKVKSLAAQFGKEIEER